MAATERKYDLYGSEFRADPACVFARMREHDPVPLQHGLDPETPIWFITKHDDVAAVLLDDERFVRDPRLALTEEELAAHDRPPMLEVIDNNMINRDGDHHRRLRRLVTKAFTPKMVEQLRPRIQTIADELIDAVEPRREMDLSAEYAFPLPITVIAELLGVPNVDQDRFKEWSDGGARTPAISPSGEAATTASARRSPAWRRRSRSRRSSGGCRTCVSPCHATSSSGGRRPAFAGSWRCP